MSASNANNQYGSILKELMHKFIDKSVGERGFNLLINAYRETVGKTMGHDRRSMYGANLARQYFVNKTLTWRLLVRGVQITNPIGIKLELTVRYQDTPDVVVSVEREFDGANNATVA